MWLRVSVKNWRSIEEADVELGPFTVLVGRNSSGKSNFVDAIKFVEEVATDAATAVAKRGGITSIRRWSVSKPYDIKLTVRSASTKVALETDFAEHAMVLASGKSGEWSFKSERIEVRAGGRSTFVVERTNDVIDLTEAQLPLPAVAKSPPIASTTSAMLFVRQLPMVRPSRRRPVPLPRVRPIRPAPDEMRKPQPPSETELLSDDGRNVTTALDRMHSTSRMDVVRSMQRIVPGLSSIDAEHIGRYLSLTFRQQHDDRASADFAATEMSEGALRALAVIVAAKQMRKDDVLIVEEPEVNLHPGAAGVVYDVLHAASALGNVVVTTHSPELLDHAAEADILVCEYVRGVTKIGALAVKQRELVRDGLFTVAELMRSDELRRQGARPRTVSD